MHFLVTRPQEVAGKTAARLEAAGHKATIHPMMRIEYASQPIDLIDPAAIVLTSSNAVRSLAQWPVVAEWRHLAVFAVGDKTALSAREIGFADIRIGRGDWRGLYNLLRASVNPATGPLLYPTSPNLPDLFPRKLAEAGFSIFAVNAYRRIPAHSLDDDVSAALIGGKIDAVLFYSRQTATVFADLARKKGIADRLGDVGFYVLAQPIVEPLKGLNPAGIWIAERPDENSLFELLPVPAERQ